MNPENARNALMHRLLQELGPVLAPLYGAPVTATLERNTAKGVKEVLKHFSILDSEGRDASALLERALTDALQLPEKAQIS